MRPAHRHIVVAALLLVALGSGPAQAERREVMLGGYPLLSQKDPANYRDPALAAALDTLPDKSRQVAVGDLACAATAYTIIERGRGNPAAMIDDFYVDPRPLGGDGPGARRPSYVGEDIAVDPVTVEASLGDGRPVILHGFGGPLGEHFVVAVGLRRDGSGAWRLVALDPWPGKDQTTPGREIEIPFDAGPLAHPFLAAVTFTQMRLMQGAWPKAAPVVDAAPAPAPPAATDSVALRDGSVLVGTIASVTLAFQTSFGEAQVPTEKIAEFKDGTLTLSDGSTLKGSFAEPMLRTAKLEIATAAGVLAVPVSEIASIHRGSNVVSAPTSPSTPTAQPLSDGRGVLTGRVFDNFGKPLSGAQVSISGTTLAGATAADGRYSVPYVPGIVKLVFSKTGYATSQRGFQISGAAEFPVQDVHLLKLPSVEGIALVESADYSPPLAGCEMRLERHPAAEGELDLRYYASGDPTIIDRSGRLTFVNGAGENFSLFRLDNDGRFLRAFGTPGLSWRRLERDASRIEFNIEEIGSVSFLTADVEPGTYAFPGYRNLISDNLPESDDAGRVPGKCSIFEVFRDAEEAARVVEEQKCIAKPNPDCVLSMAVATAENAAADEAERIGLLAGIAGRLAETKATAQALQMIAKVVDNHSPEVSELSFALAKIAAAQIENQDVAGAHSTLSWALNVVGSIQKPGPRALQLPGIALLYARIGERAMASDILSKARDSAVQLGIKEDTLPILAAIARAQTEIGDMPAAVATVAPTLDAGRGLKDPNGYRFGALSAIAQAFAASGDGDAARLTLLQSLDSMPPIGASTVWIASLASLSRLQGRASSDRAAQQRIQGVIDSIETSDRLYLKLALADAYSKNREFQHSLKLLEQVLSAVRSRDGDIADDIVWTIARLAATQAEYGDKPGAAMTTLRAMELSEDIAWAPARARCLAKIGEAFAMAGDKHSAVVAFERVVEIVRGIGADKVKYQSDRYEPLLAVAKAQHAHGDSDAASRTLGIAFEVASNLEYATERSQALAAVALAQADLGYTRDGLGTATLALTAAAGIDLSDRYLRHLQVEALTDIAVALSKPAR